jgi:hypothetical protein
MVTTHIITITSSLQFLQLQMNVLTMELNFSDKNPTETFNLFSHGKFCDVDDHYEHLSRYLSESVLNKCNANGVPTHKLILKVDDICLITQGSNCINFQKSHQC